MYETCCPGPPPSAPSRTIELPQSGIAGRLKTPTATGSPEVPGSLAPPGNARHLSCTGGGCRPFTVRRGRIAMLALMQALRIALAQIAPRLGQLDVNLERHHALLRE